MVAVVQAPQLSRPACGERHMKADGPLWRHCGMAGAPSGGREDGADSGGLQAGNGVTERYGSALEANPLKMRSLPPTTTTTTNKYYYY